VRRCVPLVVAALLVAGCASPPPQTEANLDPKRVLPGSTLQASGFLADYSQLQKVPGRLDTWQWVRPGVDWKQYTKIYLAPVEVWINPGAEYPGIQPALYKQIVDEFRGVVAKEFRAGGYEVVDRPGPGVLVIRFALTGVNPERPGFTPLDVLPIKIAIDAARFATGTDKTVIAMSGEAEVRDGATNERLFAQVTTRKDAHLFVGSQITWADVSNGATEWAEQARARLDKARGVTR
jgi:Protein of unknown function (DUF3313)